MSIPLRTRPVGDDGRTMQTTARDVSGRDATARWIVAVRRIPTSTVLLGLVAVLCVVGTIMVGSASEVVSIETYGSPWSILIRQCMWMVLGAAGLAVTRRVDYHRWRRFAGLVLAGTFVLLLAVLVPGIGTHTLGSSRWLGFGSFNVQPSEMAKLALALYGADLVVRRQDAGGGHRRIIGPLLLVTAAAAVLILAQPDMGTTVVVCCVALALLFAAGVPMKPIAKILLAAAGLAVVAGLIDPYRRQRLLAFLNPGAHASGSGYQILQSLIGMGSGHLFGVGLGNGQEKWGFLPNAHTDFIFSVIGEELGLVGAVLVLALLGGFAWFGLRAATRAPDRFGALLAVALVAWISAEAVINVGAVIGLLPVTGIPLPFISFGGSSLVITMAAAGVLVNIARQERPVRVPGRRQ